MTGEAVGVFAYGSLVSAVSATETLGREELSIRPAVLSGWRRSFSLARDNRLCEKTFAGPDGEIPAVVLALNVEPDPSGRSQVNGAVIVASAAELARLDRRELRYDRIDVSAEISLADGGEAGERRVFTYVAKPENYAPTPPVGAVILASYERAVEAAFASLGAAQLDAFRNATRTCAAPRIEGTLVTGDIAAGNPRGW